MLNLFKYKVSFLRLVFIYLKLCPGCAVFQIAAYLVKALLPTVTVVFSATLIDTVSNAILNKGDLREVLIPLALVICTMLTGYGLDALSKLMKTKAECRLRDVLAPDLQKRKAMLAYAYFEDVEKCDVIKRVSEHFVQQPSDSFELLFETFQFLTEIAGLFILIGRHSWFSVLLYIVTVIPSLFLSRKLGAKEYEIEKEYSELERHAEYISSVLTERDYVDERTLFRYSDRLSGEYCSEYDMVRKARNRMDRVWWVNIKLCSALTIISGLLSSLFLLPRVLETDGVYTLSIGMFTALIGALIRLSGGMQERISQIISDQQVQKGHIQDTNDFLSYSFLEETLLPPATRPREIHTIEFKDVSFQYPGTSKLVLNHLNLTLKEGTRYAVVGVNGAGKTTLVKLLTGLYDKYEGKILLNGQELRTIPRDELKAVISVLYQDFGRYPLSLKENISIGSMNEPNLLVDDLIDYVDLREAVESLSEGKDTHISKAFDNSVDMSDGEWQRIAIARLIASPAQIKVLDEPTAFLNPTMESNLYSSFNTYFRQKQNTITVFISHRLASTRVADQIIVLSDGKVAEMGSFEELQKKDTTFSSLFNAQAKWYQNTGEAE